MSEFNECTYSNKKYSFENGYNNFRTNAVIGFIDVHVKALASIVFGGPHRDVLFALAGSSVLDVHTGQIAGETTENGYLYVIRDLGARGHRYSRLIV